MRRLRRKKPVIAKSIAIEPPIVKSIPVEPAPVEPAPVEPAKSAPVHTREATVKSTHSAAMEPAKSAPVETSAATPAMRPGIGEFWLAEHGGAQQRRCDCQRLSVLRPGFMFV